MSGKKIIILEDESNLLKALSFELIDKGFSVLSATSGKDGVKMIKKEKPDLILLDLLIPDKNGFDVLEKLRSFDDTKNIPVFVISNLGQKSDKDKCLALGAKEYFVKATTDLDKISKKIEKLFS